MLETVPCGINILEDILIHCLCQEAYVRKHAKVT